MRRKKAVTKKLTSALALALSLAVFTGTAAAGGGNGNGNGNSAATSTSNGNSANAPGQEKKAEQAQPQTQSATQAQSSQNKGKASSPGQQKKAEKAASTSNSSKKSAKATAASGPWVNAQGKPKNNVPAAAASIPPESTGPGPGNSGWHKYTVCHNGHAITVDVHSAKAHVEGHGDTFLPFNTKGKAACGESQSTPGATSTTTQSGCPSVTTTTTTGVVGVLHKNGKLMTNPKSAHFTKHNDQKVTATSTVTTRGNETCSTGTSTGTAGTAGTAGSSSESILVSQTGTAAAGEAQPMGGVLGVTASLNGPANAVGGVLGAVATLGTAGTLPFPGVPLWLADLIAVALILVGTLVVRRGRTTRDVV
jgi:hypothetical protein